MSKLSVVGAALCAVIGLAGCTATTTVCAGSCSDAGTGAGDGPFVARSILFLPDGPGAAGRIWLELEAAHPQENRFTLRVVGDELAAYGVAGRLLLDPSQTAFGALGVGPGLAGDGVTLVSAAKATAAGVTFGVARSVVFDASAALKPTRPVATLELTVSRPGTSRIDFDLTRSRVLDHEHHDVVVSNWLGGRLVVE
jgi:hypothetical protein